ncbi:MAG TPA: permease-like cell division protein FtsX [Micromonosporaceae bacterium]|nr:permease-like cell division protein FtsX [Micromonosporaceae bacterium]
MVVAAVAMVVGALAASTVFLVVGHQHHYAVYVYLHEDVTTEQKGAIESALDALQPVGGIRFESGEQAFQRLRELFQDSPDMIRRFSADALPESFRLTTKSREFDCARLVPIWRLPGVNEIQVVQVPTKGKAPAVVGCGPMARPTVSS